MKKIFCLILSVCVLFATGQMDIFAYTDESTELNVKTIKNAYEGARLKSEKNLEINQFGEDEKEECREKLLNMSEKTWDESVSLLTVSYYSGTIIPTYTSVTGLSLYYVDYSNNGENVFYSYYLDADEQIYYMDYLTTCGWDFYTKQDQDTYISFYFVKGDTLIQVTADFVLGLTVIGFAVPTNKEPTSVSLNITSRTMIVGNSYTLEATVSPSNAVDKSIVWSSSNTSVASVSENGIVTAKKAGTATITAKTSNGKKATCSITVKNLVLKYYESTTIPTFTCITGKSLAQTYVTDDGTVMYIYDLDIESHVDYEIYLMKNGWELLGENKNDEEYTITAVYQKKDVVVVVIVDAMYQETIIFELDMSASTSTVKSGNKFIVTPQNVPEGSCIAFACYKDDALTDIQLKTYYNEDTLSFIATQAYDEVKIFVWESMYSMNPLCNAENVRL